MIILIRHKPAGTSLTALILLVNNIANITQNIPKSQIQKVSANTKTSWWKTDREERKRVKQRYGENEYGDREDKMEKESETDRKITAEKRKSPQRI